MGAMTYEARVAAYEARGLTTSDAQAVADADELTGRDGLQDFPMRAAFDWQTARGLILAGTTIDGRPDNIGWDCRPHEVTDGHIELARFEYDGGEWEWIEGWELPSIDAVQLACGLLASVVGSDARKVAELLAAAAQIVEPDDDDAIDLAAQLDVVLCAAAEELCAVAVAPGGDA